MLTADTAGNTRTLTVTLGGSQAISGRAMSHNTRIFGHNWSGCFTCHNFNMHHDYKYYYNGHIRGIKHAATVWNLAVHLSVFFAA